MANRIDPLAHSIKGTDPRHLIEKITREKVYGCVYWKQECFGLTAASVVDKAVALKYVGGTFGGNRQPTPFLCLVLKLLQLQPEKEIILEYIRDDEFKYLRALGAYYLRLTGKTEEVFSELEPLYNDYRKIAMRTTSGWKLSHMDEYIDELLQEEFVCDIQLPHIPKRTKLEDNGVLEPRVSALEKDLNLDDLKDFEDSSENSNNSDGESDEYADEEDDAEIKAAKLLEKTSNKSVLHKYNNSNIEASSASSSSVVAASTKSGEEEATKPSFLAADKFSGFKTGYAFTNGKLGLGYYLDSNNNNNNNGNNSSGNSSNRNGSSNNNYSSSVANKLVNLSRGVDNRPSWMTDSDAKSKVKDGRMDYDNNDGNNNDDGEGRRETGEKDKERVGSSSAGGSDRAVDTYSASRVAAPGISIESDRVKGDRSMRDDRRNNDQRRSRSRNRDRDRDRDRDRGDRDRYSRDRGDRVSRDRGDRGSRRRDDRSRDRKDRRRSRSRSRSDSRSKRRRSRSPSRDDSRDRSKRNDNRDRYSREKSYDNINMDHKASRGIDNDPALITASGVHDSSRASSMTVSNPASSSSSSSSSSSEGVSKSSTSKFDRMFGKRKPSTSDAGNSNSNSNSNSSSNGSSSNNGSNSQSAAGSKRITLSNDVVVETSAPEGSQEYWNAIRQGYGMKTLK